MIDSTVITYADPKTSDTISEMEFNSMLQHSYEQALAGEGRPIEDVFTDLERTSFASKSLFLTTVSSSDSTFMAKKKPRTVICSRLLVS